MTHFLIDYDHDTGGVTVAPIDDTTEALAAYSKAESEALGTSHEVVLLGAESEDDLRKTHARYFLGVPRFNGGEPITAALSERLDELNDLTAKTTRAVNGA